MVGFVFVYWGCAYALEPARQQKRQPVVIALVRKCEYLIPHWRQRSRDVSQNRRGESVPPPSLSHNAFYQRYVPGVVRPCCVPYWLARHLARCEHTEKLRRVVNHLL